MNIIPTFCRRSTLITLESNTWNFVRKNLPQKHKNKCRRN